MKKSIIFLFVSILALPVLMVSGQTRDNKIGSPIPENPAEGKAASAEQPSLVGEWELIPNNILAEGSLKIGSDGKYTRAEKPVNGTGSSVTGPYIADNTVTPATIDLCLGECGGPGSEWTTMFCIYRFNTADRLEIRCSPDSKRPTEFATEPDAYTMLYVRKVN